MIGLDPLQHLHARVANMEDGKYGIAETSVAQINDEDTSQRLVLRASSPRGLMIIYITATAKLVDDML